MRRIDTACRRDKKAGKNIVQFEIHIYNSNSNLKFTYKIEEIGPSIMRALEERLKDLRISPETQPRELVEEEKALFLSKIEVVRQKLLSRLPQDCVGRNQRMGPPKTRALPAAKRSVRSGRNMSRSAAETLADEVGIVPTIGLWR
jgi:hypothetical protein